MSCRKGSSSGCHAMVECGLRCGAGEDAKLPQTATCSKWRVGKWERAAEAEQARKARERVDRGGLSWFCWCAAWLAVALRTGKATQRIEEGRATYQLARRGVLQVHTHFLKSYGCLVVWKFYVRCTAGLLLKGDVGPVACSWPWS